MEPVKTHHDLEVWRMSMALTVFLYGLTDCFPSRERYGLSSQIRRSAVSIPSNIAEGASRNSPREFRNFITIALASATELETQLELASRLGFIEEDVINITKPLVLIRKMLINLRKALDRKIQ